MWAENDYKMESIRLQTTHLLYPTRMHLGMKKLGMQAKSHCSILTTVVYLDFDNAIVHRNRRLTTRNNITEIEPLSIANINNMHFISDFPEVSKMEFFELF